MADDSKLNEPNPVEDRIKDLSSKVKTASDERDAEKTRADTEMAKATELTRERDFYQGFTDVVATNPAAKDHKDDILAKVKSGYTVKDATWAVLGEAGKLGQMKTEEKQVTGGSATTTITQNSQKSPSEMTQEERRAALADSLIIT